MLKLFRKNTEKEETLTKDERIECYANIKATLLCMKTNMYSIESYVDKTDPSGKMLLGYMELHSKWIEESLEKLDILGRDL